MGSDEFDKLKFNIMQQICPLRKKPEQDNLLRLFSIIFQILTLGVIPLGEGIRAAKKSIRI